MASRSKSNISAVFEGLFAGVALLALSGTRGRPISALLRDGALWIGFALMPTILVAGVYARIGHFHEWLFANLISILERGAEPDAIIRWRVTEITLILAPLCVAIPLRRWLGATPTQPAVRDDLRFLDAWAACSLLGVVLFGTWFNHYALPTLAPLAVIAAPLFMRRLGQAYVCLVLIGAGVWGQHILHRHAVTRGNQALLAEVAEAVREHRNCLFVYDGLVATYDAANSCLPTSHVFPTHFAGLIEHGATGISQENLVRDIIAQRPDRVTSMEPAYTGENLAVRALLYRVLHADYTPIARFPRWNRTLVVYGLKH